MQVYLDSCIVIYLHEGEAGLRQRIRRRLLPPDASAQAPCVSELSRLECRVAPLCDQDDKLLAAYDRFFALSEVKCVELNRAVFGRATELRAAHGFRTPDALHLAAAIEQGCTEFWTNDRRLTRAKLSLAVVMIAA